MTVLASSVDVCMVNMLCMVLSHVLRMWLL